MTERGTSSWWRSTFGVAASVGLISSIATAGIGAVAYEIAHEALEHQLDRRAATETRALLAEPGGDRIGAVADAIRRREAFPASDHLLYLLVDGSGRRVAGGLAAQAPRSPGTEEFLDYGGGRTAQALTTALPGGGRLVVAADRSVLDATDRRLLALFAAAFGATALLGAAGAWIVGAVTRGRLRRIDRAALAIIGGDAAHRMPRDGSGSEFDALSATLNRMLDRTEALVANLRQVSSGVAHDLRTPLTRLRNRLEEAVAVDGGSDRSAVEAAVAQADELLELFAALLRISEVEALGVRSGFARLAPAELVNDLVETYRPDFEDAGRTIVVRTGDVPAVLGDRRLLQQAVSNLLENVLRHTPIGTTATVTVSSPAAGGRISVLVSDDGPGVDGESARRLFDRFFRAEASRSAEGHGLGLALVRAVAAAHGGAVRHVQGPGFAIELVLPTA